MIIREEKEQDYDAISSFITSSFETAQVSDGNEASFVVEARCSYRYIPELALIAEEGSRMIGYIMLSRTFVHCAESNYEKALLLAPVCVDLQWRSKGVGTQLVNFGKELSVKLGYEAIFLAGNPDYYCRFGFLPTMDYHISFTEKIPEEYSKNIMACELKEGALAGVEGMVELFI